MLTSSATKSSVIRTSTSSKSPISEVLKAVRKQHGDDSIYSLSEPNSSLNVSALSSGHFALDSITGIGGIPCGRITEIFGPESTGKTTLALKIASQATKSGRNVAFIDVEHALNVNYALKIGLDPKRVLISQPDSGEQALRLTESLVKLNDCDLVILDSVAALVTQAEIDNQIGAHNVGSHARLMSTAVKKLTPMLGNTTLLFINQVRMKIGVLFGNPEVTTGGNALKFYSSMRMEVRRGSVIKDKDKIIGHMMKVKVVKNKMAAPLRTTEIELLYSPQPACTEGEVIDVAVGMNIIDIRGSHYYYKDTKLGQGRLKAIAYLKAQPEITEQIKKDVKGEVL